MQGINMQVIKIKPVNMAEAKEVMVKREKEGELKYEQKIALENLRKFTRANAKDAKAIVTELEQVLRMSPEVLVQIINNMPKNPDELRLIFARERFSLKEDEIAKILSIIKKYS